MGLDDLGVVVLAAGKGKRFGETYTKLLHPVLGKPLIYYSIANLKNLGIENIIAVVSDPKVENEIRKYVSCQFVYQEKLTGTAIAVKLAIDKISLQPPRLQAKTLMVLNGDDATLYTKKTLDEFLKSHELSKAKISLMTMKTGRKVETGRIIRDKKKNFSKILEHSKYVQSGIKSQEINCGVYLIDPGFAKSSLPDIPKNPNGEYYLTDLLNIAKVKGEGINLFVLKDHSQWIGVNSKKDLKYAESVIKRRQIMTSEKNKQLTVHFLGIAGSGTSACAKIAQSEGFKVSGCDQNLSGEFMEVLGDFPIFEGHNPKHLEDVDILAITPAVLSLDPDNPEILEAKKRKVKILTWQQFLGKYLTRDKFVIAVSGTHGKSTTTAMVGKILEDAKLDPTVLLGATTSFWGSNFRIGQGKYFVIEADEFNDNFLSLAPDITIVTNIEFDHPEYFENFEKYQASFRNFLAKTKHLIIADLSDQNSKNLLQEKEIIDEKLFPPVIDFSKNLIDFPLKVSGYHNILNASAAFNLGLNLEIQPEKIKQSLQTFPGIGRRMEYLGRVHGVEVFSDFAHHPTEVKTTIEAFKKNHPGKDIFLVFQPHMFSRTKVLFNDFVKVFKSLPIFHGYIMDIYPSREIDTGLITSEQLVKSVDRENIKYCSDVKKTYTELTNKLTNNDLVVFMGAGDIDRLAREFSKSYG